MLQLPHDKIRQPLHIPTPLCKLHFDCKNRILKDVSAQSVKYRHFQVSVMSLHGLYNVTGSGKINHLVSFKVNSCFKQIRSFLHIMVTQVSR